MKGSSLRYLPSLLTLPTITDGSFLPHSSNLQSLHPSLACTLFSPRTVSQCSKALPSNPHSPSVHLDPLLHPLPFSPRSEPSSNAELSLVQLGKHRQFTDNKFEKLSPLTIRCFEKSPKNSSVATQVSRKSIESFSKTFLNRFNSSSSSQTISKPSSDRMRRGVYSRLEMLEGTIL